MPLSAAAHGGRQSHTVLHEFRAAHGIVPEERLSGFLIGRPHRRGAAEHCGQFTTARCLLLGVASEAGDITNSSHQNRVNRRARWSFAGDPAHRLLGPQAQVGGQVCKHALLRQVKLAVDELLRTALGARRLVARLPRPVLSPRAPAAGTRPRDAPGARRRRPPSDPPPTCGTAVILSPEFAPSHHHNKCSSGMQSNSLLSRPQFALSAGTGDLLARMSAQSEHPKLQNRSTAHARLIRMLARQEGKRPGLERV